MNRRDLNVIAALFASASRLQKKRAYLTIASITWGTVAILLLLAFGQGLRLQLDKNRRAMGENISVIWPGDTTKAWKGMPPGRPIRLRFDDLAFLRERIPEAKSFIGEISSGRTAVAYGPKTINARVNGVSFEYGEARKHYPQAGGRFLTPGDLDAQRRVAFLGDEMAKDLFGDENPAGKTILINNAPFTVVGVMQHKTQMGAYQGPDAQHAVIPITTAKALFGRDRLNNLLVEVSRPEDMPAVLKRTNEVLGAKYGFDPTDDRVLQTWDTVKSSKIMKNITLGIELFLGIIGALTLIIGGVGVANIMYAVVKERTREIGVKMALGARSRWIVIPFVLEGLIYTLVGGAFGILIATIIVTALSFVPIEKNEALSFLGHPTLSWQIGVFTSAILGLIGTFAGYFPARRAAAVDPAATLRYE